MRAVHGSPNQTEQREGVVSRDRNRLWSRGSHHLSLTVKADGRWGRGVLVPSEQCFRAQPLMWCAALHLCGSICSSL